MLPFCWLSDDNSGVQCEQAKRSGVVRELPRVGVTDNGEVQVMRDEVGDVHIYAKSIDDVLIHRKKDDSSKVALLLHFLSARGHGTDEPGFPSVSFSTWFRRIHLKVTD